MRFARCASRSRSPSTTSRAGKGCARWSSASIAHSSGPIPAGSPDVMRIAGCALIAYAQGPMRSKAVDRHRGWVTEDLHIEILGGAQLERALAIRLDARLRETVERPRGRAEDPQHLQRFLRVDFARMLHGAAKRQRVAFAAE